MAWDDRAARARRVLIATYWDRSASLFRTSGSVRGRLRWWLPGAVWHYWWQAHALDTVLDAVEANDPPIDAQPWPTMVRLHLAGIAYRSGGDVTDNEYVDDLAWLGLATLRAHRLGIIGPALPRSLAEAVLGGHDPELGGFHWRFGDAYHNVPATAPAATLLAGAAEVFDEPRWWEVAEQSAEWLHATLVDHRGLVRDGARMRDGRLEPEGPLWSYNVGTVAGLDVTLAGRASGAARQALLTRAGRVLRAGTAVLRAGGNGRQLDHAMAAWPSESMPPAQLFATSPGSVSWRDEITDGAGLDPQLFRGILARNAAQLVLADPDRTGDLVVDLVAQGEAAWHARDGRDRIAASWRPASASVPSDTSSGASNPGAAPSRRPPKPSLAAHLSGTLTLGALARLEEAGILAGPGDS